MLQKTVLKCLLLTGFVLSIVTFANIAIQTDNMELNNNNSHVISAFDA